MKFKTIWICLIIIVFSCPSICFSEPDSKSWEFFSDNFYYNKTNLTKSSNIISIWTYYIVTDDVREKMIEGFKKNDLEKSIKYKSLDHLVRLNEIDCKNILYRVKESRFYDDKGHVLDSQINLDKNSKWRSIPPETPIENLYQKLCATQEKPIKNK